MKRRDLTPEEEQLWQDVASSAKPLLRRKVASPPPARKATVRFAGEETVALPTAAPNPGIDRTLATRLRKGELPIDATLDMHGMTRDKAHRTLMAFLKSGYARGSRCLLVVTGKGTKRDETDDRGVLRELVPQWLEVSEMRPAILAMSTARPQHGGTGAMYILLRRKR